jgi:hypothetical protein
MDENRGKSRDMWKMTVGWGYLTYYVVFPQGPRLGLKSVGRATSAAQRSSRMGFCSGLQSYVQVG